MHFTSDFAPGREDTQRTPPPQLLDKPPSADLQPGRIHLTSQISNTTYFIEEAKLDCSEYMNFKRTNPTTTKKCSTRIANSTNWEQILLLLGTSGPFIITAVKATINSRR
jgi:hypothetical protein